MMHHLNENELPNGFNLLDLGDSPDLNRKETIFTSSIETSDLSCNYCEYQGEYITICIKLKRPIPPRTSLFNFIVETEACSKSLIGEYSEAYFLENWFPAHVIFSIPTFDNNNPHRLANFIITGLQVRLEATINQGSLITLNQLKRDRAKALKLNKA